MEVDTGTSSSFGSVTKGKWCREEKGRMNKQRKKGIHEWRIKSESDWNKSYDIGEECPKVRNSWSWMSKNQDIWKLSKVSNASL